MPYCASMSRSGTTIGGWLTIRYCPSTTSPSLDRACRLSRVRALRRFFSARSAAQRQRRARPCLLLGLGFLPAVPPGLLARLARLAVALRSVREFARTRPRRSVGGHVGVPEFHGAHLGELGHRLPVGAHRCQGDRGGFRPGQAVVAGGDGEAGGHPLTSYSNGPGRVSSKSLRSNNKSRSGEANTPKFDRCASPHSCVVRPGGRGAGQIGGHDLRRTAVERERGDHHPAVPDRHQVGLPGRVLLLEQGDRVRPVSGGLPTGVQLRRGLDPRVRALRAPDRQRWDAPSP